MVKTDEQLKKKRTSGRYKPGSRKNKNGIKIMKDNIKKLTLTVRFLAHVLVIKTLR
jgi:hypothetical protein